MLKIDDWRFLDAKCRAFITMYCSVTAVPQPHKRGSVGLFAPAGFAYYSKLLGAFAYWPICGFSYQQSALPSRMPLEWWPRKWSGYWVSREGLSMFSIGPAPHMFSAHFWAKSNLMLSQFGWSYLWAGLEVCLSHWQRWSWCVVKSLETVSEQNFWWSWLHTAL